MLWARASFSSLYFGWEIASQARNNKKYVICGYRCGSQGVHSIASLPPMSSRGVRDEATSTSTVPASSRSGGRPMLWARASSSSLYFGWEIASQARNDKKYVICAYRCGSQGVHSIASLPPMSSRGVRDEATSTSTVPASSRSGGRTMLWARASFSSLYFGWEIASQARNDKKYVICAYRCGSQGVHAIASLPPMSSRGVRDEATSTSTVPASSRSGGRTMLWARASFSSLYCGWEIASQARNDKKYVICAYKCGSQGVHSIASLPPMSSRGVRDEATSTSTVPASSRSGGRPML